MKKFNMRNVLVPIDFSEMSIGAIATAKNLARRSGAAIHLIHVQQFHYPAGFIGPVPVGDIPMSFEENRTDELSRELRVIADKAGLSTQDHVHVRHGMAPFDEICRLAQEIAADVIVMPTHGRTGLKHVFLGSTAERVVQHSPCPVLIVRNGKLKSIDVILVPVDFSKASLAGLESAIALANQMAARLIVFHAVYFGYVLTADGYALYDLSEIEKSTRKEAEQQMREFVRAANFGGVKFETKVTIGPPIPEIESLAKDRGVDLIVTSTHGWTGFKHVLLGSTAEQIVRYAPCSVLVVPAHPAVRRANLVRRAKRIRARLPSRGARLTRKDRRGVRHPSPERRQTNKFRETHSHNGE